MMVDSCKDFTAIRFQLPHPTIIRIKINSTQAPRRRVKLISKYEIKTIEIVIIATNHVRDINMMEISIHIMKCGFKSNGDVKTPRVL